MRGFGFSTLALWLWLGSALSAGATTLGQVRGVVHDPQHRPVSGATVVVKAVNSSVSVTVQSDANGEFTLPAVALGVYTLRVSETGFATAEETFTVAADATAVVHVQLELGSVNETVSVSSAGDGASVDTVTPTTLVGRVEIAQTPGADRTNSMAMITDYVPGAYMTHDQLHLRGGHQVSWLIDGVEIPNTNIASNVGAQIDPRDIDTVEVERGSYTADVGDRTYGVFNVVPRTGFERNREAEVIATAGSFLQTDDQINVGDHTDRSAYYASVNGNRSDYGLSPPIERVLHDVANGLGGFASLISNRTAKDQLRLVVQARRDFFQIPYDPNPSSFENQQFNSSGLRDTEQETDGFAAFSWIRTFNSSTVLEVSPFFHANSANYRPGANDSPAATTSDRSSIYGGGQGSLTYAVAGNTLKAGIYSFGQHDSYRFGVTYPAGSGSAGFSGQGTAAGGVVEEYVSDNWKAAEWLTLIAGVRQTRFVGAFTEDAADPRVGAAVRVPKIGWTLRGFYGRFYQPPPLLTAAGPLLQFAQANDTSFKPLHGERDEAQQFGVQIPWRGWLVDADTFRTRVNNFLDHSSIGNSSLYFPVTVDGALIRAWELAVRSPLAGKLGSVHLAYSNQIAEQRGAITGGLVCAPVSSPQCDAEPGYHPVDHDQRNTLSVGVDAALPRRVHASADVSYGSGFVNGSPMVGTAYPNAYLPAHTALDLAVSKTFGADTVVSVNALNVANQLRLLDNSVTFGGFHESDPRQIYGEVRYRFHY